jgi:hypothetical protein
MSWERVYAKDIMSLKQKRRKSTIHILLNIEVDVCLDEPVVLCPLRRELMD